MSQVETQLVILVLLPVLALFALFVAPPLWHHFRWTRRAHKRIGWYSE